MVSSSQCPRALRVMRGSPERPHRCGRRMRRIEKPADCARPRRVRSMPPRAAGNCRLHLELQLSGGGARWRAQWGCRLAG
eukprot:scaffold21912_cov127-Isochrysis_galbana.AAC.6